MTNWPNIQEYRNFEAKFFDKPNESMSCAAESGNDKSDLECIGREDLLPNPRYPESKTVRCVITKDFEEGFKKLDRGDGLAVGCDLRPKIREATDHASVDKIRLQNHLKWKKQKEEEYLQKKEAVRLAHQKKKEEEERLEKVKKQKEKEREGKIREWQEQKTREKEEKKKEKMVMKMLEEELKGVTPAVDKDKLIEEWVKLKNKQKQMEAEKQADILKKKEESRALRQSLAELSYRQWKERVKGRMMTLPKNGYQIFGPKPVPVVKEDWNHDFATSSPREEIIALSSSKSNTIFRSPRKALDDYSKNMLLLENFKARSPLFHLKSTKSGLDFCEDMPLKELQPGSVDSKKNPQLCQEVPKLKLGGKDASGKPLYLDSFEKNQKHCLLSPSFGKPLRLLNVFSEVLPDKKKIDLYIDTNTGESSPVKQVKKPTLKKPQKKEPVEEVVPDAGKKKAASKMKLSVRKSLVSLQGEAKPGRKPEPHATSKLCRRSRSFDMPLTRDKGTATSKSTAKIPDERKASKPTSKASCGQRRKIRRQSKPNTPEAKKKATENEGRGRKKPKKKSPFLSKSLSLSDSPYWLPPLKKKGERRKGEAKSDRADQARKSSTSKI